MVIHFRFCVTLILCYNRFMNVRMKKDTLQVIIYTDGSSLGNPGVGGYGAVIVLLGENKVIEIGKQYQMTTNNKMELTAIIHALEYLQKNNISEKTTIAIHTDSSYAINGITKWIAGWKKKDWMTSMKQPVLNDDLWKQLDVLVQVYKSISWHHVRGHSGIWGNERCDQIATGFASTGKVDLYNGPLSEYDDRILKTTQTVSPSKKGVSSVSQKKSGKAYSYVSVIAGKVETHKTWEECKRRVDGKSAKFKKVFSEQEEKQLIAEWNHLS